jgi:Flp pilus assembly pilin Flp
MNLMLRLWSDEAGFVVSSELILIAAIVVMGMLTGMATIRDQVVQELGDVGDAVSELSQTFRWQGTTGHTSSVAGTIFVDVNDFCEAAAGSDQTAGAGPQCILLSVAADGNGG